ncbi:MAG: S8 family serine peptidase [Arcicella sp.]|nr:S8 family serine peptidase [Arcicella sp.]
MKNQYLFSFILLFFSLFAQAQTAEDRAKIVQEYNKQNPQLKNARQATEVAISKAFDSAEIRVKAYLLKYPLLKRTFVENGSFYYLKNIDKDGNPVYINTKSNVESGTLIKANQFYTGGTLGVNITGQNMVAGIWDGGQVRATHELLSGRVTMQPGQPLSGNAANSYAGDNHQTHVTGTMVGKDIANQRSARGIAYGATALNYDWENDLTEMLNFAKDGYVISNHSYGYGNHEGDPIWRFGAYNDDTRAWDQVALAYPTYLPFVAGGNERDPEQLRPNRTRNNGNWLKLGYDMITGSSAAKNVMTVGAVNSDKTMSGYSNWGPTDDGRVKPEIVTRGTGINSSQFADKTTNLPSDNSYSGEENSDGTSYAAPAAAAGGLLLQQYYKSLYGNFMKAATLKALMLGTAEDLGQPGPDHKFGWGLLDVEKAAQAIKTRSSSVNPANQSHQDVSSKGSYIEEITYNLLPYTGTAPNTQELTRSVKAKGGEPLIVSIAWTDAPGAEQTSANGTDPTTSRLVHEFDMLVSAPQPAGVSTSGLGLVSSSATDFRPWRPSTMANRTADATLQTTWFEGNGDNYKQVKILNPVAGTTYQISLRKKDTSPDTLMPLSIVVTGTALDVPTCTPPTLAMAGSNSPVVATTPLNLTSSATGGTAYAWAGPNGFTSTMQNPTVSSSTTAAMAGIYTVTIASSA